MAVEPVTRTKVDRMGGSEERETHPAFGVVQFNRVQGNPGKLFGSHLNKHAGFIRLRVCRAERVHSLSRDRITPAGTGPDIVEVDLSFTQFAELLTSMNMGEGVPCTIRRVERDQVAEIPEDLQTEQEKVADGFQQRTDEMSALLKEKMAKVEEILAKKSIGKADRDAIRWAFGKVLQDVEANLPFVQKSFIESTEKTVQAAKAEVDGFMTGIAQRMGIENLKDRLLQVGEQHDALGEGNSDGKDQ